ncbi:Coiled-coil domain-containing protein SCD2, partial [Ananas comosus]
MDRLRAGSPVYGRQRSGGGSSSTGSSSPGGLSPAHHRSPSASSSATAGISSVKRTQNVAARAAAARLAQVMASQSAAGADDDDDYDDDIPAAGAGGGAAAAAALRFGAPRPAPSAASSNGAGTGASLLGRSNRSPSPASILRQSDPHLREGHQFLFVQHQPLCRRLNHLSNTNSYSTNRTPADRNRQKADAGHLNSRDTGIRREASAFKMSLICYKKRMRASTKSYDLLKKDVKKQRHAPRS